MSKINRVGGSPVSRVEISRPSTQTAQLPPIAFNEQFTFPDIDLDEQSNNALDAENDTYREILFQLFHDMLSDGMAIHPGKLKDHGSFVVEASFVAAKGSRDIPKIILPLRGVDEPIIPHKYGAAVPEKQLNAYIDNIIEATNRKSLLRLIIVASHEYGHFLSSQRGNHDQQLQTALYIMHSSKQYEDKYLWQIFREECLAWKNGYKKLIRYGFTHITIFEQVKNHSLQVYFKTLNLKQASIDTLHKLSFLGDDFFNNSTSDYFSGKRKKA